MRYIEPNYYKKQMTSFALKSVFLVTILIYFTSCTNGFTELSSKDREAGLIKDIEIALSKLKDPASALIKFNALPAHIKIKRDHQILRASIYASLCGQDFLNVTSDLAGAGTLMVNLMAGFPGATTVEADNCTLARDVISAVDPVAANRTLDENLMMAYVSWSTMGSISSAHGDLDDNGIVDGGFDPCLAGTLPDSYAVDLGVSINHMIDSVTAVAAQTGVGGDQLTLLDALCTALGTGAGHFCGVTDPAVLAADAAAIKELRSVVKSDGGIGLAVCPACFCP